MAFDKGKLQERMLALLHTVPPKTADDVSEFVRSKIMEKLKDDWDRAKSRSGMTVDERIILEEAYDGPHEDWRWHLYHTDPELWRYLTNYHLNEFEPLTDAEVALAFPEFAREVGLVNDDPEARLGLKVGTFGTLTMKRGPDKMVCITEITARGKVKAEKFNEETEEWTAPGYIDPDMLTETWESDDE
ncbi:MAG: hypothetical protein GY906_12815 [bacterium]|nr:hypothetical protein [bacterium]